MALPSLCFGSVLHGLSSSLAVKTSVGLLIIGVGGGSLGVLSRFCTIGYAVTFLRVLRLFELCCNMYFVCIIYIDGGRPTNVGVDILR